ncbi:MAG: DUF6610 family protein [Terriglobia bacterium]
MRRVRIVSKTNNGFPLRTYRPHLITCHGRFVSRLAQRFGWLPGARYTNLRDIRGFGRIGLIDIAWKDYDFARHLAAVKLTRPLLTVAKDIQKAAELPCVLDHANELSQFAQYIIIVPKDARLAEELDERIPRRFLLGYSVPTRYGGTCLPLDSFKGRPVHLLGGRPDVQLQLAKELKVFSVDINRFTLDASFGDYFDGEIFRPHPKGGYIRCITDSIRNIRRCWELLGEDHDG